MLPSAYIKLLIFLLANLIPACASSSPAFLMMHTTYKLNKQGDNIQACCTPFPIWNQVCCSMCSSKCCFLTCIQISQEAGKVVWYSHLLKNVPEFFVIHTVQGFGILNKVESASESRSVMSDTCNPMDYTVHGILQARILKWVFLSLLQGSSQPRDWTQVSLIAGEFFTSWATSEAQDTEVGSLCFLQWIFLTQ